MKKLNSSKRIKSEPLHKTIKKSSENPYKSYHNLTLGTAKRNTIHHIISLIFKKQGETDLYPPNPRATATNKTPETALPSTSEPRLPPPCDDQRPPSTRVVASLKRSWPRFESSFKRDCLAIKNQNLVQLRRCLVLIEPLVGSGLLCSVLWLGVRRTSTACSEGASELWCWALEWSLVGCRVFWAFCLFCVFLVR